MLDKAVQSDSNNGDALGAVYRILGAIFKEQPEQADKVLQVLDKAVQSDSNNSDALGAAYGVLSAIFKAQPEHADKVLQVLEKAVMSDKNSNKTLNIAYETLGAIFRAQPEQADKALQIFDKAMQNDRNERYSLNTAYRILGEIVKEQPEQTDKVLQMLDKVAQSDNGRSFLGGASRALGAILEAQPEQTDKVFQMVLREMRKDSNNYETRIDAYNVLSQAIDIQPALTKDAVEAVLVSLSTSMDDYGVDTACNCINDWLSEKKKPFSRSSNYDEGKIDASRAATFILDVDEDMTEEEVTAAIQEQEKAKRKKEEEYRTAGQKRLDSIDADLARDVFKLFYVDKFDSVSREDWQVGSRRGLVKRLKQIPGAASKMAEVFIKEGNPEHPAALHILAMCQKKARPDDFANMPPEWNTISKALANLRFSTENEIDFACDKWNAKKISEYSFSAQQRVMNVLVAELGKENKLPPEALKRFRKGNNAEVEKMIADNGDWLMPASFKAADVFGCWFPNYLKKTQKAGLSTHDAVYWLPEDMGKAKNESFSQFIRNNILYPTNDGKEHARPLRELDVIARNWKTLTPEQEKMRYKDVLAVCMSRKYDNQKYDNFAVEAAKFGYKEEDYHNMEQIYQAGLGVPEPFDSSKRFEFTSESGTAYVGRFLPRDDARVGFFGGYTGCCQHYGGVGDACAVSSVKDPYSQLFVIENDKGRIIAGSWVWENTDGKYRDVCFDNIEAIGEYANHPVVNKIYEQVGNYLAEEAGCRLVTIGQGHQDADIGAYWAADKPIPLPRQYQNGYSDARSQVVLSHNPKAKPLDKSQESQRFIRDVCFLDEAAMDRISERCFPESDGRLQQPENLAGKVIVDKDKGVVGYCLWDEQEKSVYDMAVLPEYRKDKNASSSKLFLETQKEIRKIGGEWTAELRDKTTYRYMKMMQLRGMVKMDTLEVDHEMSDGSKVYQVRFTPLEKKRGARQQTQENAAENNGARADEVSGQESQGKRFSDVQMMATARARQDRSAG